MEHSPSIFICHFGLWNVQHSLFWCKNNLQQEWLKSYLITFWEHVGMWGIWGCSPIQYILNEPFWLGHHTIKIIKFWKLLKIINLFCKFLYEVPPLLPTYTSWKKTTLRLKCYIIGNILRNTLRMLRTLWEHSENTLGTIKRLQKFNS